ncbi:MAG: hypothetical protein IPG99_07155 [Ignavibacteria bacterium]|nr:hypothetical protein [Ignavibacteria bacterium]
MSLISGKHIEKELDGIRCRIVESGISEDRMNFLKKLLEHNGYEVKCEKEAKKEETLPDTYSIGVTEIIFNPVIAVYERKLRTHDGKIVTPQYWRQTGEDMKKWYWKVKYEET